MKELLLLFIIPIIGLLLVIWISDHKKISKFLLPFSGAYLISLVFMHILPDIYLAGGEHIGIFILIGFFLQVLLDYFSKGIEHGHVHIDKKSAIGGLLSGLYLHAFVETIPLGMGENLHYSGSLTLFVGILFHKLPVSFVMATLLLSRSKNKFKVIAQMLLFAVIAPLGYLYGYYFPDMIPIKFEELMAIVVGIFLHVGTTIIFESSDTHKINLGKLIAISLGFILSILLISL